MKKERIKLLENLLSAARVYVAMLAVDTDGASDGQRFAALELLNEIDKA
jgi:hypothetical protein